MDLREKVVEMKKEVEELRKDFDSNTLALDLLKELKAQNKRQHIIIIALISLIVAMIIGFFVFVNQYEIVGEETIIDSGSGNATYLENSKTGDINYGEDN